MTPNSDIIFNVFRTDAVGSFHRSRISSAYISNLSASSQYPSDPPWFSKIRLTIKCQWGTPKPKSWFPTQGESKTVEAHTAKHLITCGMQHILHPKDSGPPPHGIINHCSCPSVEAPEFWRRLWPQAYSYSSGMAPLAALLL